MTFVFPYQGARGGFFHSSAALLPLLWSAATIGFNAVLEWAQPRPQLEYQRGKNRLFDCDSMLHTLPDDLQHGWSKFAKDGKEISAWEKNYLTYQQAEAAITEFGAVHQEIVLTINPPGYYELHKPASNRHSRWRYS